MNSGEPGPPDLLLVLFVDEDQGFLDSLLRQSWRGFRVHTAVGPVRAQELLAKSGSYAVVVAALRMTRINGVQFLARVRSEYTDTIRILRTAEADLGLSVAAVNQGDIFRLLIAPCTLEILRKAVEAGIRQYQLVTAERRSKRETQLGCEQAFEEILAEMNPDALGRGSRIRNMLREITASLHISSPWQYEAAGILSQVGWILNTLHDRDGVAARIIRKIPQLSVVAEMIEHRRRPYLDFPTAMYDRDGNPAALGAQMLRAALDLDDSCQSGLRPEDAVQRMRGEIGVYNLEVLRALVPIAQGQLFYDHRMAGLDGLCPGMILVENILSVSGVCLLGKGQEITAALLQRLWHFSESIAPNETWKVRVRKPCISATARQPQPAPQELREQPVP